MGAKLALEYPMDVAELPDIRRYTGAVEAVSAFLGAVVAGLLLMAPLDLAWSHEGPLELDLLVLNMPRAAAAGALFAVVAAALGVALGKRAAWLISCGSATVLLVDHLWNLNSALTGTLITVNYIDSIFGGMLLGALAVAVFGKPKATTAYLIGALASILLGDLTSLPDAEGARSAIDWLATGTPPLWLVLGAAVLLAVGAAVQAPGDVEVEATDLPIGPIVAALVLVTATALSTEWFVRHESTVMNIVLAAAVTLIAVFLAALLLPGRDGTLVLMAVAVTNSGSAIIAVPRPDWSAPLPLVAVAVGMYAGRRWYRPWSGFIGTAGLAIFAAFTAPLARTDFVVPLIGITMLGLLLGYCFSGPVPRAAPSLAVALAALIVPCLAIALRGSDFGRVAYSPRWYRDPTGATSMAPGWMALAITIGCALGMLALYRLRPFKSQREKRAFTQPRASSKDASSTAR